MSDRRLRWLALARLTRVPNVFTALADIALGSIVAAPQSWNVIACLAGSSACLYSAGMVWNDLFDIEQDARERPFRPLPSGDISPTRALGLAIALTLCGWGLALLASPFAGAIAGVLVAAILLYNRWLKRTSVGSLGMGACRFLNVLLGMSAVDAAPVDWAHRIHLASVVGLYVVGVTAFARREAGTSQVRSLRYAVWIGIAALALAVPLPLHKPEGTASPLFPYLLVSFGIWVGLPAMSAVTRPDPGHVQAAVKRAVLAIIGLDAVLATAVTGTRGLLILLLLPPALLLGRRVYST